MEGHDAVSRTAALDRVEEEHHACWMMMDDDGVVVVVFVVVVVVAVVVVSLSLQSFLWGQFVPGERRRFICGLRQQAARSASNVCVCMHVCVCVVAVAVCGSPTFGPEPALPEVGVDQHAHA